MAKKALLTIDGVYRKVKIGYLTVDGAYHKVKKAYITIGGVWRPCWAGGGVEYYGEITSLYATAWHPATASSDTYASFADDGGGVNFYNASLIHQMRYCSDVKTGTASTHIGQYILVANGMLDDETFSDVVDFFDKSLTRTTGTNYVYCRERAATTAGTQAFIHGGYWDDYAETQDPNNYSIEVFEDTNVYNSSLTLRTTSGLAMHRGAATFIGTSALFAGGYDAEDISRNEGFRLTESLTYTHFNLSTYMGDYPVATTIGNYALFTHYGTVNAFDASLTRTVLTNLFSVNPSSYGSSEQRGAVAVGDHALFAGGPGYTTAVDVVDTSLTRVKVLSLTHGREHPGGATIGNYALFGGGAWLVEYSERAADGVEAFIVA